jgi:hypothetical protein
VPFTLWKLDKVAYLHIVNAFNLHGTILCCLIRLCAIVLCFCGNRYGWRKKIPQRLSYVAG